MTTAEGRRFAWTLAAGFSVLAVLSAWRGRFTLMDVFGVAGGIALVAGVFVPTRLGPIERAWTALGIRLSRVTAPVFLGIVYFVIVTPTGWIRRTFGRDPIARERAASSFWVERAEQTDDELRESFEHLY